MEEKELQTRRKLLEEIMETENMSIGTTQINGEQDSCVIKEKVLILITSDLDEAFDILDDFFSDKNGTYNDLSKEYINRPENFSLDKFRSKLKRFVKTNM